MGMSRWAKATSIPAAAKRKVEERDNHCCIFCGQRGRGEAHFIPRSKGGKGIEENLLTVCRTCHVQLDNPMNKHMHNYARAYLKQHYQGWDERKLIYRKYGV